MVLREEILEELVQEQCFKSENGAVAITRVRKGLGIATNNDAENEALINGLKTALDMGYDRIHAQGDSELVYKQRVELKGGIAGNIEDFASPNAQAGV